MYDQHVAFTKRTVQIVRWLHLYDKGREATWLQIWRLLSNRPKKIKETILLTQQTHKLGAF